MRIGDGDVVLLVTGRLADSTRQMLRKAGIDPDVNVLEHVVGARVDCELDSDGRPNGRQVIIGRRVDDDE